MSYRRRRGLGSEPDEGDGTSPVRDFLERVRRIGGRDDGADRLRRWGLGAAIVAAAALAGYLIAAELLFPASSPAEAEPLVRVPAVQGSSLEEARSRIGEAGLSLRVAARLPAADAEEGRVLAQRPLGGQRAAAGDTVAVTVAGPEAELRVPALRALRGGRARRVLRRMGFAVDSTSEAASVAGGEVVRTEPAAGTLAPQGSTIRIVMSEGPPVSGVPELVGRHVDDVRAVLADSGLALAGVSYDSTAVAAPGRVVAQSPPPGFSLRQGGRVTVRVAGLPRRAPDAGAAPPDTTGRR